MKRTRILTGLCLAVTALGGCSSLSKQDQLRLDTFKINSKRYFEEGQFRRAEDTCRKGLMVDSEDMSLLQVLGFSLLSQGGGTQVGEAVSTFRRCLEVEDEFDIRSRLGLAEALHQWGRMWTNELARIDADENLTLEERQASVTWATESRDEAYLLSEEALREVLGSPRGRDNVMARSTMARLLTVLGRYDEAAEVLRTMTATLSASIQLRTEQLSGEALTDAQRPLFERVLKSLSDQHLNALELLANVAAKTGRWEEVISAFAQIEALEGMAPADYFNRATAYEALGARDAAIIDYDTFVTRAASRGAAFDEQVSQAMRRKAILLEGGELIRNPAHDGG